MSLGSSEFEVLRVNRTGRTKVLDNIVAEAPLEIRVAGKPLVMTMRTPGDDDALAVGYLYSEGVILDRSDLLGTAPCRRVREPGEAEAIDVFLSRPSRARAKGLKSRSVSNSSCGFCGKTSWLDQASVQFRHQPNFKVKSQVLLGLSRTMQKAQSGFNSTGGIHGAALFTRGGRMICLREDVGRHNAVDKVIGAKFLGSIPECANPLLMVSGRVSYEIVTKARMAQVRFIAAVSAPTSAAVELARSADITLVGFLREDRFNVYSGWARIQFPP